MRDVQIISMVCIATIAMLTDLWRGKIYNGLIVTGLLLGVIYQIGRNGILGVILFLGGMILPLLLFGLLFYFRMIGAGDIKLLCIICGFLGPSEGWKFILASIIWGGLISVFLLMYRRCALERLRYFTQYVSEYSQKGIAKSYLAGTKARARFCFSIPILMGLLWYLGGIL